MVHTTCLVSIELSLLFPVHQLNVWKLTALRGVIVACVYICSIELYARIINMKISCK